MTELNCTYCLDWQASIIISLKDKISQNETEEKFCQMLTTFQQSNAACLHHAAYSNMNKVMLYAVSEHKIFPIARLYEWF